MQGKLGLINLTRILAAPIGVVQQSCNWFSGAQSHLKSLLHQVTRQSNFHRPVDDFTRKQVQLSRQASQATFALLENELLPLFLPRYCSQLNPIEGLGNT